jgi:hypothetical protein
MFRRLTTTPTVGGSRYFVWRGFGGHKSPIFGGNRTPKKKSLDAQNAHTIFTPRPTGSGHHRLYHYILR